MTKFYQIAENVLGASIGACVVIYIIKVINSNKRQSQQKSSAYLVCWNV